MNRILYNHIIELKKHVISATEETITIRKFKDDLTFNIVISNIYHALGRGELSNSELIRMLN